MALVEALVTEATSGAIDWENQTLPDFLAGVAGFLRDLDGYYANNPSVPQEPSWHLC